MRLMKKKEENNTNQKNRTVVIYLHNRNDSSGTNINSGECQDGQESDKKFSK